MSKWNPKKYPDDKIRLKMFIYIFLTIIHVKMLNPDNLSTIQVQISIYIFLLTIYVKMKIRKVFSWKNTHLNIYLHFSNDYSRRNAEPPCIPTTKHEPKEKVAFFPLNAEPRQLIDYSGTNIHLHIFIDYLCQNENPKPILMEKYASKCLLTFFLTIIHVEVLNPDKTRSLKKPTDFSG